MAEHDKPRATTNDELVSNAAPLALDGRTDSISEKGIPSGTQTPGSLYTNIPDLAVRKHAYDSDLGPVSDWFAHHLHIRRRRAADLDDVATQPSVYDTDQAEFFQPRDDWEVSIGTSLLTSDRGCYKKGPLMVPRTLLLSIPNSGGRGAKKRPHCAR
jgi:hypothetical protein